MFLATTQHDTKTRYGATFIIASGAFSFGALTNAQVSANLVSDTARAAGIGTNVMMGNIGGKSSSCLNMLLLCLTNSRSDLHMEFPAI